MVANGTGGIAQANVGNIVPFGSPLSESRNAGKSNPHAQQMLKLEAWHEPAHRYLIWLYAKTDQPLLAMAQYEKCRQILAHELGIEPSAETKQLLLEIQELRQSGITFQPKNAIPSASVKVPAFLTDTTPPPEPEPFVGRTAQLEKLHTLLDQTVAGEGQLALITGMCRLGQNDAGARIC